MTAALADAPGLAWLVPAPVRRRPGTRRPRLRRVPGDAVPGRVPRPAPRPAIRQAPRPAIGQAPRPAIRQASTRLVAGRPAGDRPPLRLTRRGTRLLLSVLVLLSGLGGVARLDPAPPVVPATVLRAAPGVALGAAPVGDRALAPLVVSPRAATVSTR